MAITESFVPSEIPGVLRPEYRVKGDSPWQSYPTREAAEKREAEINGKTEKRG